MTERATKVWQAFCGELTQQPTEDMKEALATALRECSYRLCTDWAEMQHPYVVLEDIADEIDGPFD
jgi:hypothetical protein